MELNKKTLIRHRILIVDDIEDNILLIEDHLQRELNCEFRRALSGDLALKILKKWKPDCILMDIMMPEMDGIETTKRIKILPECQDIPVIMVTAKQEFQSFENAFDTGAVDYIYKPVERTTLVVRVKSALRSKEDLDRIKELNKELLKKKQELSSFSHTVSHDLKSPVVGAASLYDYFIFRLKNEYPQVLNDDNIKDILDRIPMTFQKMLDFINTQLEYAEAGRVIGDLETVSMGRLISTVMENFEYAEREGMVSFVKLPEMPDVSCDPIRMLKVWQNLIANSIKYRGKRNPVKIEFGGDKVENYVQYWIRDNGPGIIREKQEKVFEINARLNFDVEGYGFGLATAKKIVEAHRGKIWIDSEVKDGARFVCKIPNVSIDI